jgi:hypothetical protein
MTDATPPGPATFYGVGRNLSRPDPHVAWRGDG